MRHMDKARADNLSVQSLAIIKNSEHRNFVIGRFQTRARNGLSVWDWPVHSRTRPKDTPSPIFSEGRGRLYTRYLKRIIHLQTVRQTAFVMTSAQHLHLSGSCGTLKENSRGHRPQWHDQPSHISHFMGWVGTVSMEMDWEWLQVAPLYADVWAYLYINILNAYCKRARLLSFHPWFLSSFLPSYRDFNWKDDCIGGGWWGPTTEWKRHY